jgi:hypothetical protein
MSEIDRLTDADLISLRYLREEIADMQIIVTSALERLEAIQVSLRLFRMRDAINQQQRDERGRWH